MVKVSIAVRSGAAHFDVAVQARSIHRAICLVKERHPEANVRVKFPIEPESFFVEDVAAQGGQIEFEEPQKTVA